MKLYCEDMEGNCVLVTVYNFPGLFQANLEMLNAYFPIGTVMAIREPWMKMSGAVSHPEAFIRIDAPSDIIFLEPSHALLQGQQWKNSPNIYHYPFTTADQWRISGIEHFKKGFLVPAVLAWSRGLKLDPSMQTLHLNRSQAYIRLGWFSSALADALHALSSDDLIDSLRRKAQYRAACAEYGLGRYADSLARLEVLENDNETDPLKERCRKRICEVSTTQYAWVDMFKAGQSPIPRLDVAEFVDTGISISAIPGRGGGRGIRATRDFKTGELLVSSYFIKQPLYC